MTGAQGTSGPGGGPGPGQASLPPVGSAPDAFDPGRRLESVGQGYEVGYSIAAPGVAAGLFAPETPILPIALVAGGAAAVAYDFVSFFQDLFGGSPDYPPNYFTFQHRLDCPHRGPHPLYTAYIGVGPGIVVGMGGVRLVSAAGPSPNQPNVKDPQRQPEYRRQQHAKISFGACLGLAAIPLVPSTLECAAALVDCGTTLAGNPEGPAGGVYALPYCSLTAAFVAGCYAASRGKTVNSFPQDLQ